MSVQHSAKKDKIEVNYYGTDDLQRILELLGRTKAEHGGWSISWPS